MGRTYTRIETYVNHVVTWILNLSNMDSSGSTPGIIAAPERPQPGPRAYVCGSPAPNHCRLECAGGPWPTASGSTRVGRWYPRVGDCPESRWELAATIGRQLDFLSLGAAVTALLAHSGWDCSALRPSPRRRPRPGRGSSQIVTISASSTWCRSTHCGRTTG